MAQCNDEMVKEMAGMYVEQVKAAVGEEGAASMAGDLKTFLDDANLQLDTCTPGGDAGGGGEAGGGESDGGEEAPQ